MQKLFKILLLSFSFFTFFFFQINAIDTIDAGFDDRFEFSKNEIKKNEKIKVYSHFDNNSEFDLKASATFYIDNKKLESKNFSIPKNTRLPVWTTIRISEKSTLKITLNSLQKDTNGVLEGVYSSNKEARITISPDQSVPKLSKVQTSVVNTSKNIIDVAEQKD